MGTVDENKKNTVPRYSVTNLRSLPTLPGSKLSWLLFRHAPPRDFFGE